MFVIVMPKCDVIVIQTIATQGHDLHNNVYVVVSFD